MKTRKVRQINGGGQTINAINAIIKYIDELKEELPNYEHKICKTKDVYGKTRYESLELVLDNEQLNQQIKDAKDLLKDINLTQRIINTTLNNLSFNQTNIKKNEKDKFKISLDNLLSTMNSLYSYIYPRGNTKFFQVRTDKYNNDELVSKFASKDIINFIKDNKPSIYFEKFIKENCSENTEEEEKLGGKSKKRRKKRSKTIKYQRGGGKTINTIKLMLKFIKQLENSCENNKNTFILNIINNHQETITNATNQTKIFTTNNFKNIFSFRNKKEKKELTRKTCIELIKVIIEILDELNGNQQKMIEFVTINNLRININNNQEYEELLRNVNEKLTKLINNNIIKTTICPNVINLYNPDYNNTTTQDREESYFGGNKTVGGVNNSYEQLMAFRKLFRKIQKEHKHFENYIRYEELKELLVTITDNEEDDFSVIKSNHLMNKLYNPLSRFKRTLKKKNSKLENLINDFIILLKKIT
jgi:hypothetical protein